MQGSSDIINPLLPPGFRFHPTDEELIVHYLRNKVSSSNIFFASLIADVDLYKFDPWELPDKALFGENEWFFFSPRDRKYPNGARPNRAATSGYWKATGTDKAILSSKGSQCIGVKKALVFYQGRPPKGSKTSWMMYEYRLLNHSTHSTRLKGSMRLDDWVLCRIRHKSDTPIKFNARNDGTSPSYNALDTLQENDMIDKLNYLDDIEMPPKEREIFDNLGLLDWKEATSLPYFTQGTLEIQTDSPSCPSNTDALATIKRVLSVGTIDEQVLLMPNKTPCSITCSNSDESGIFDQNFTY